MTCTHCNDTKKALYFSEISNSHEMRDCHMCRPKPEPVDVSDMVSGPYQYQKDLHPCFRIVLPEEGGRLVACVYATETEERAEEEAELFARALRRDVRKLQQLPGYTQYTSYRP